MKSEQSSSKLVVIRAHRYSYAMLVRLGLSALDGQPEASNNDQGNDSTTIVTWLTVFAQ